MPDFDPHQVPVSHAATVMLVSDRPELHVLMLRRTSRLAFASNMWVFPGGRVDPQDHSDELGRVTTGLDDADASRILGHGSGGLAWWVAACRETLEEASLLLSEEPLDATLLASLAERVRQDETSFIDLLIEHQIRLDLSSIHEVARLLTPLGSPRRFDARFFVAKAPADARPKQDNSEIVAWDWVRPADAVAEWEAGNRKMMSPTVRMLSCLREYETADAVMAVAARYLPYKRIRIQEPGSIYLSVLPGDPGYATADRELELGWVRLWEKSEPSSADEGDADPSSGDSGLSAWFKPQPMWLTGD